MIDASATAPLVNMIIFDDEPNTTAVILARLRNAGVDTRHMTISMAPHKMMSDAVPIGFPSLDRFPPILPVSGEKPPRNRSERRAAEAKWRRK